MPVPLAAQAVQHGHLAAAERAAAQGQDLRVPRRQSSHTAARCSLKLAVDPDVNVRSTSGCVTMDPPLEPDSDESDKLMLCACDHEALNKALNTVLRCDKVHVGWGSTCLASVKQVGSTASLVGCFEWHCNAGSSRGSMHPISGLAPESDSSGLSIFDDACAAGDANLETALLLFRISESAFVVADLLRGKPGELGQCATILEGEDMSTPATTLKGTDRSQGLAIGASAHSRPLINCLREISPVSGGASPVVPVKSHIQQRGPVESTELPFRIEHGVLLNVLDGISYGMIMLPANAVFLAFGSVGVSMFFIITIIVQLTYSCGTSSFAGANGSMMIEPICTSEHMSALGVLDSSSLLPSPTLILGALVSGALTMNGWIAPWTGHLYSLGYRLHKKYIPISASVSEHHPTARHDHHSS
ncbi:hypothetical protein DFH11DRAFT_1726817 [Phellopilus nigrolimitatus]|nr:hypothetical protein DFH11DRAFT_1726817 [Phellopilus nigrolimitatus]